MSDITNLLLLVIVCDGDYNTNLKPESPMILIKIHTFFLKYEVNICVIVYNIEYIWMYLSNIISMAGILMKYNIFLV